MRNLLRWIGPLLLMSLRAEAGALDNNDDLIDLPGPVMFATGKAVIEPASNAALQYLAQHLKEHLNVTLLIEVFDEEDCSTPEGQTLAQERALAVAEWLEASGIDGQRLIPIGFGDTDPATPKQTARAANRRVEFHLCTYSGGCDPIPELAH
jgi:outer membrane protein OmpA-like peptidoglycan-associated protein